MDTKKRRKRVEQLDHDLCHIINEEIKKSRLSYQLDHNKALKLNKIRTLSLQIIHSYDFLNILV